MDRPHPAVEGWDFVDLAYWYSRLSRKKTELARLKSAKSKLTRSYHDFRYFEPQVSRPELTAYTFHGQRANKFEAVREGEVVQSFRKITRSQFPKIFKLLNLKIRETESEIRRIMNIIDMLKAKMNDS